MVFLYRFKVVKVIFQASMYDKTQGKMQACLAV